MAVPGRHDSVGEVTGKESAVGGRMPITPPASTDNIHSLVVDPGDALQATPAVPEPMQDQVNDISPAIAEDQTKTPKSEYPAFIPITAIPACSKAGSSPLPSLSPEPSNDIVLSNDYFASRDPQGSHVTFLAQKSSSLTSVPSVDGGSASRDSSTPASPDTRLTSWKDFSAQHNVGSTFRSGSTRPTSVPNFQTKATSRRREGPDYPNYPDQSFRALQDQHYPPPYQPGSPHQLRTRSSHSSQNVSFLTGNVQPMSDTPPIPSGAKTVGNTPAQSPGLFSPTVPVKKQWPGDSDDGRSGTPMLHPTHHKPPKETHKLVKDIDRVSGRKTINHYEIYGKLGSGQHGTVKQGKDQNSEEFVAVKIVRRFSKKLRLGRTGDPNDMIKKEVAILKKARHPHVVSLIEVIDDDEFGKVYLILEYVERGEIIWRKQTDKAIAHFEMERIQREIANNVNEDYEKAEVARFNEGASVRRLEKARLLETQKIQAKERFKSLGNQSRAHSVSDFWSMELAPNLEDEAGLDVHHHPESDLVETLQPSEGSLTTQGTSVSPQSESQLHTPKPHPMRSLPGSRPASVPSSRPDTPARSETSMWSPFSEESFSNLALRATLDEIIAGHYDWKPEEEDFRYVPCLTLNQALDAFRDTVLGLEYLHYQGIIHRDIKPANLLWTADYRVKISDFGVSYLGKPIREDDNQEEIEEADAANLDEAIELAKTVGTPAFYAPELCDPSYFESDRRSERPAITGQIDVWALGVTLYGMVFGRLPFWHHNEFQMYERIARQEVFIPQFRLKGVEHTDKTPSNHNKRLDDVLEYEEVDDELRDLLKRLLDKQPSKRITLKEVKHHPWVLRGISDQVSWLDETDPSLQSQGRKIEVSTQEVQDAVVGLTLVDRVKAGFSRVGSVLRGRGSRKRADSSPKHPELKPSETRPPGSAGPTSAASSQPESSLYSPSLQEGRRSSLPGNELINSALRASREGSEHPLAQSVAASPEIKSERTFFEEGKPPRPVSDPQAVRPTFPDRTLSTADSMKTIRAPVPATLKEPLQTFTPSSEEAFSPTTVFVDPSLNPTSSLGGIFGGAGRRFVISMRSRERGVRRQSPSQTSRSSSVDTNIEDPHASPSLAISSAIAAGHMDQPPALRDEPEIPRHLPNDSISEGLRRPKEEDYRRQTLEHQRHSRRPTASMAAEVACPPSPDDETFLAQQRPASAADSTSAFQISSSSDQIVSGESTAHSRIPSVFSGASSLSAAVEEKDSPQALHLEKPISPLTIGRRSGSHPREESSNKFFDIAPALAPTAAEEEAGYTNEGEQDDSDSDEGLAMA